MDEAAIDGHEVGTGAECRGMFLEQTRLEPLVGSPVALVAEHPAEARAGEEARRA